MTAENYVKIVKKYKTGLGTLPVPFLDLASGEYRLWYLKEEDILKENMIVGNNEDNYLFMGFDAAYNNLTPFLKHI